MILGLGTAGQRFHVSIFEENITNCGRSGCGRNEKYYEAECKESAVKLACAHFLFKVTNHPLDAVHRFC